MRITREQAFSVLELQDGASVEDIRRTYKRLALKWHPDKNGNSQESTVKFQEISAAFVWLTKQSQEAEVLDEYEYDETELYNNFGDLFEDFENEAFDWYTTKEERPTLAGVQTKTRKRNIIIPIDPKSFADAVIAIFQDALEGGDVVTGLETAAKNLDAADLDFSKYGDTLFEVLFAGGRLAGGGALAEDQENVLAHNIFAATADREAIAPYVKVFQLLTRRRKFLHKNLENTLTKLLLSLEFFDPDRRKKLAIATALVFSLKVGVLPENLFGGILNDRLITKGTVLEFLTDYFKEYLTNDSMEDLVGILTKAKIVNRLLDFFPPSKRTLPDFNKHFTDAGLDQLVDWNLKREQEAKLNELQETLAKMMAEEPPASAQEMLTVVKTKKTEGSLPDQELLRIVTTGLMKSVNMTGKNQQQILQGIVKMLKTYGKVLLSFLAGNGKLELSLLVCIQVLCYEDNRLLKQFSDIVKVMYDLDILKEDTIMHWYKKGSHPKGRTVFLKDIEPFIKWLEEAEEEAEGEEDE